MTPPEFDVADSFKKKPDRSASLSGKLGARPARRRPEPAGKQPSEPEAPARTETPRTSSATAEPRAPRRRRGSSSRTANSGSDRRLVVALPAALRDRARAYAASRAETYLDVLLAAVEAVHDQLPQLLDTHRLDAIPTTDEPGGLFDHQPRQHKEPTATVQVTFRGLSAHDRGVLEDLVESTGAANLTEMITVALDEHLPGNMDSDQGE